MVLWPCIRERRLLRLLRMVGWQQLTLTIITEIFLGQECTFPKSFFRSIYRALRYFIFLYSERSGAMLTRRGWTCPATCPAHEGTGSTPHYLFANVPKHNVIQEDVTTVCVPLLTKYGYIQVCTEGTHNFFYVLRLCWGCAIALEK